MFAFAASAVSRVIPVVTRVATNPVVVRHAVTTAKLVGVSVGLSVLHRQGRDIAAQHAAESLAKQRDPEAYVYDERRIGGLKDRAKRNVSVVTGALTEEVSSYRAVAVPFYWVGARVAFWHESKVLDKFQTKHEEDLTLPDETVLTEDQTKVLKKANRLFKRYENCVKHMARAKSWLNYRKLTPGEEYLDQELVELKRQVVENEVQTDSVPMVYVRLLEENIDLDKFTLIEIDAYAAGQAIRQTVEATFDDNEVQTIGKEALLPWFARHFNLTDRQMKKLQKGFFAADRVEVAGKE